MTSIKKTLFGALIGIFAFAFNSAAFADMTIKHVSGETTLKTTPKKIVVFDLASLDNLGRLGVNGVIGIPQTPMPDYLTSYKDDEKITKVGSLFEPNYELVANLNPDLIIIAGRSQPKYGELSKIAPTIDLTVSNDTYLDDVKRNVTLLGTIFDKSTEAKSELETLEAALNAVKEKAANKGNSLLILTTGGKMSAFGPGSRFGLLYSGFGVTPAAANLTSGNHGQMISPEFILETNPDWLFVIDRDAAIGREGKSAAQLLDNALVKKTSAGGKDQIVYLNPQNWYLVGGSLSGLHETADQLNKVFSKQQ